jgi:hypothetical protein
VPLADELGGKVCGLGVRHLHEQRRAAGTPEKLLELSPQVLEQEDDANPAAPSVQRERLERLRPEALGAGDHQHVGADQVGIGTEMVQDGIEGEAVDELLASLVAGAGGHDRQRRTGRRLAWCAERALLARQEVNHADQEPELVLDAFRLPDEVDLIGQACLFRERQRAVAAAVVRSPEHLKPCPEALEGDGGVQSLGHGCEQIGAERPDLGLVAHIATGVGGGGQDLREVTRSERLEELRARQVLRHLVALDAEPAAVGEGGQATADVALAEVQDQHRRAGLQQRAADRGDQAGPPRGRAPEHVDAAGARLELERIPALHRVDAPPLRGVVGGEPLVPRDEFALVRLKQDRSLGRDPFVRRGRAPARHQDRPEPDVREHEPKEHEHDPSVGQRQEPGQDQEAGDHDVLSELAAGLGVLRRDGAGVGRRRLTPLRRPRRFLARPWRSGLDVLPAPACLPRGKEPLGQDLGAFGRVVEDHSAPIPSQLPAPRQPPQSREPQCAANLSATVRRFKRTGGADRVVVRVRSGRAGSPSA